MASKTFKDGVTVVDKGWKRIVRTATALGRKKLKVGVIGSEAANEASPGITMARLAGVHEYGAVIDTGAGIVHIPERSFLRGTIEAAGNYRREIDALAKSVIDGKRTEEQALGLLGAKMVGDVKKRIAAGIGPANAPSTIAAKGSDTPLIDTGRLRQSITWAVVPESED